MYNTNTKWLKKGYYHNECNVFMDCMIEVFNKNNEEIWRYDKLIGFRNDSKKIDNTHKFFF